MTNAEARFNNSLRPRKPEGSLGRTAQDGQSLRLTETRRLVRRTAQDVHLDCHTAPERCSSGGVYVPYIHAYQVRVTVGDSGLRCICVASTQGPGGASCSSVGPRINMSSEAVVRG